MLEHDTIHYSARSGFPYYNPSLVERDPPKYYLYYAEMVRQW